MTGTFSATAGTTTFNGTSTFSKHSIGGNWINNGTFTAGTGTINLNGSLDGSMPLNVKLS